ncbi:MAG: gamma-glutamyltransferase [Hyphomicrobiales bacterium]|nr:gamma-glutamyltransferase [Hyphomicrobiales bacterium]
MTRVAIASSSQIAADAGAEVADADGNAIDAAIAASLVQLVTEPGVVSLAAGALIVVWPAGADPVMIDAASEMPGREMPANRRGRGGIDVMLAYGGGTPTTVGHASVATPGALAGYDLAARRYGISPWRSLVQPACRYARDGFAMSAASQRYIETTHTGIFGWNPGALRPLQNEDGTLKRVGEIVRIDHLDDSLAAIAEHGAAAFYRGDIARLIARDVQANDGLLSLADLEAYAPRCAPALDVALDDWHLATASVPSVGGVALAAMMLQMGDMAHDCWTPQMARHLIETQTSVMRFRRQQLDTSVELASDAAELLEQARATPSLFAAPSTVHTSTVDEHGNACAITASAGYGSGVMPPGTGIWLNNSLGEVELNRRGFHALTPGTRIPSNMAPTTGRSATGSVLSIGSPGADRITTAILQTITNFVHLGMTLCDAVNHPRLHVEWPQENESRVAYEAGMPVNQLDVPQRRFELDMFFGGVTAVNFTPPDHFEMAADIRRTGGTALSGATRR